MIGAGHVMDLQPAMSVPVHMLLGRPAPPARSQSLFTGPSVSRAARISVPAAGASGRGMEQPPEPSVGAPLSPP